MYPCPTPETGHVSARSHSQKPARFPAEQKERSFVETLLFPVSRGRRYNTLYFASKVVCQGDAVPVGFPATKPPVSLDSSGQRERCPLWIPLPTGMLRAPYWMTLRQRKASAFLWNPPPVFIPRSYCSILQCDRWNVCRTLTPEISINPGVSFPQSGVTIKQGRFFHCA